MKRFPETGKWIIEGDTAFACLVRYSTLVEIDLCNERIENAIQLSPNGLEYDCCVRLGNQIVLLPSYRGKDIAIYDITDKTIRRLAIPHDAGMMMSASVYENRIYTISLKSNSIYEINIDNDTVQCIYGLQTNGEFGRGFCISKGVLWGITNGKFLSGLTLTGGAKTTETIELPRPCRELICKDGLLILSGYQDELFIKNNEDIRSIRLPDTVLERKNCDVIGQEYSVSEVVMVGQLAVLIPYQSEVLLYTDVFNSGNVQELNLKKEMCIETKSEEDWGIDYRVLYVRDDRLLGLYLFKEKTIAEIDMSTQRCSMITYDFSRVTQEILGRNIMQEDNAFERELFRDFFDSM